MIISERKCFVFFFGVFVDVNCSWKYITFNNEYCNYCSLSKKSLWKYCWDERFVYNHEELLMSYVISKRSKKLKQFIESFFIERKAFKWTKKDELLDSPKLFYQESFEMNLLCSVTSVSRVPLAKIYFIRTR